MTSSGPGTDTIPTGRRAELLAAAREVLAANGYERTTVSSIATRAKVAQGTFYLYFPSKEALPGALADQMAHALGAAAAAAAASSSSLDEALEALVEGTWRTAVEFADVLLIANRGIELCDTWDSYSAVTAPWREQLEAFLRRFQDDGQLDAAVDPSVTAYVLRDLLDRSMKAKVLFGQDGYAAMTSTLVRRALTA